MSTTVATQFGTIEGERRGAHSAFLGIPYAKPPLGALRFRAPEPPASWAGVRSARAWGAAAIQGRVFAPGLLPEGEPSEDCLYLNVYTPQADGKKRTVLVWIHGGAYTVGTAGTALYDGGPLATRHDVVVVTLNYRLGSLGFLALGDEGARFGAVENRGLLDQIAALTWVRDNIEAFGGNPEDVTVFGESAGATSVSLLLATPSAKGLFKRAIMQSSTAPLELPTADGYAEARAIMLRALSIAPGALDKLNDVPVALLSSAQAKVESQLRFPHFFPVFDRALFPAQPRDLHAAGEGSSVPVILGWNRDEFNLFALANLNEWSLPLPEETLFADAALRVRPDQRAGTAALLAAYRGNREKLGLPHDNRAILRAIDGDRAFRIPSLRLADALRAKHCAVYAYHFTYGSPALGGALGACHALELPFVFGTHDTPEQARFVGKGEAVATLSQRVMALWTSFARTGEPVSEGVPAWPTHAPDRFATLELDVAPRIVDDPFGEERRAWEGLF